MPDFHYRMAERLIRKHEPLPGQPRLRSLGALQLEVSLEMYQHVRLD